MYCPCPMRTSKKSTRTIFYPVWKKMTLSVAREFTTMHAGWKTGCYILLYVSVRTYYKYNNIHRLGIYVYNGCYVLSVFIVENYKSCSPKNYPLYTCAYIQYIRKIYILTYILIIVYTERMFYIKE